MTITKERLTYLAHSKPHFTEGSSTHNGVSREELSEMAYELLELRQQLEKPAPYDGWIKCSERMPEPFTAVLGFDPDWDEQADIMHWNGGEYWQTGNEDYLTPTHWQPLAEPPESK